MNLFHLKYFIKLAELEHYTKAAKELNITQPSLSHAIASLEEEINVKLFEKKGRNIILTKTGNIFFNIIKAAVTNIDDAVDYVQKINAGDGLINIGFLRTLGVSSIPTLCRKFKEDNKDKEINFNFYNGFSERLIAGLKSGEYDVVFTSKINSDESIEYVPLGKQELLLITPKNHELSDRNTVSLEEILKYDFVGFQKNTGLNNIIMPNFAKIKKYPHIKYTAEEDQVVAGLVAQGFGISIVPDMPILESLDLNKIHIEDIEQNRIFYLAYLKDLVNIPVVYEFIKYVSNYKLSKYIKTY
ncbi:LysR family transcriptional regulator [Gemella sp. zg-1178]|uniref:LysR family transcriptional regulator n=1 Tax=Gemella sp. zg-1178 TaxID=2840372 RepID=UPI001C03E554|nr:LysR family transcriptional regulator [Gemella sp. zg-1178]MBU0278582.1 LysR family transcriptional regulator [Gemella sp. zg-1178]